MAVFDFHLHTHWSYDAFSAVEDYFRLAREKKVRAIAVTDHHLMDAYDEVLQCGEKYPDVGYVAGAELSVHCPLGSFDLVCLNLPLDPPAELKDVLQRYREWQVASGEATSRNFCERGFPFDTAERLRLLQSYRPEKTLMKQGVTHVRGGILQDYCIRQGFCRDAEAFTALRQSFTGIPCYPEYDIVIPAVQKAGGIVILAHPFGYFRQADRKRMDELREMFRLDGIECAHPKVPPEYTEIYRQYCLEHGLLSSGGSDLHRPEAEKFVAHCAPDEWLDELLERVSLRHGGSRTDHIRI